MKIPFGRWRNFEIEDVPIEYLRWLNKGNLREPLRAAVEYEIDRRRKDQRQMATIRESEFAR